MTAIVAPYLSAGYDCGGVADTNRPKAKEHYQTDKRAIRAR